MKRKENELNPIVAGQTRFVYQLSKIKNKWQRKRLLYSIYKATRFYGEELQQK